MIPRTVLVLATPFAETLNAASVADAVGRGLRTGGHGWEVDTWTLDGPGAAPKCLHGEHSGDIEFGPQLHRARALVLADVDIWRAAGAADGTFILATDARQRGVPAFAVTAAPASDLFAARIMDLGAVLHARTAGQLEAAGAVLAVLI